MFRRLIRPVLSTQFVFFRRHIVDYRPNPKNKRPDKIPWHGWASSLIWVGSAAHWVYQGMYNEGRKEFAENMGNRSALEPLNGLPEDLSELEDLEYRRITITGTFEHDREIFVSPRLLKTGLEKEQTPLGVGKLFGMKDPPEFPGSWVVTPFKVSGSNRRILINRGWVPLDREDPKTRPKGQIDTPITLIGYVKTSEKKSKGWFGSDNEISPGRWKHVDVEAMSATLNTLPVLLDNDRSTTLEFGPIGGQTTFDLQLYNSTDRVVSCVFAMFTYWLWWCKYIETILPDVLERGTTF